MKFLYCVHQTSSWESQKMEPKRIREQPWQDPIVAEVRQARETLFAEANYDIHEFCRRLAERQESSGHTVVKVPQYRKAAPSQKRR